jgi:hypothetical protein
MKRRPQKIYRLNYYGKQDGMLAQISILGDPGEVRIAATGKSFLSVTEDGLNFSPGMGNPINIQAMSSNMKYGGMLQALPFPMSLLPSTTYTPYPKQIIVPPMGDMIETLATVSEILTSMV